MAQTQGIRMKSPAHPGGFVKTEIVEALGLSVTDAAQALGITRATLSLFLNERTRCRRTWRSASRRPSASRWKP